VSHLQKTLDEVTSSAKLSTQNLFAGKAIAYTWSKLWEDLEAIRDRIYAESEKILTKHEFKLLYSIISTKDKGVWFLTEDLMKDICVEQKLEPTEVGEALHSLVHKGFLREGVILAI
jgi:hypothetical protein